MTTVQAAISRFRRDMILAAILRFGFIFAFLAALVIGPASSGGGGMMLVLGIGASWFMLGVRSVQGSRLAAESPFLIASGKFDEAETRIDAALKSFSLFKPAKLIGLHHLAALRHAQGRWQESALLCKALLGQRLGSARALLKPTLLILADALLNLNDLPGTYEALGRLYQERLNLTEALRLQQLQLDYLARIGAFEPMLQGARTRVQLAELMPARQAARVQALMALAAKKTGRNQLKEWLQRRCELLCDAQGLIAERPMLAELWPAQVAGPTDR